MDDPTPADVPVSATTGFPPRRDLTDGVVLLRGPRRSDGPAIVAGATDPEVVRYTVVPSPYGDEDLDKILQIADEGWTSGTDAVFAVCDAAHPEELLGLLGLHGVELGLGRRTLRELRREQIGRGDRVLHREIDADAAHRRHRVCGVADAEQPRSPPAFEPIHLHLKQFHVREVQFLGDRVGVCPGHGGPEPLDALLT